MITYLIHSGLYNFSFKSTLLSSPLSGLAQLHLNLLMKQLFEFYRHAVFGLLQLCVIGLHFLFQQQNLLA